MQGPSGLGVSPQPCPAPTGTASTSRLATKATNTSKKTKFRTVIFFMRLLLIQFLRLWPDSIVQLPANDIHRTAKPDNTFAL
jgi:hypothetical protein